MHEHIKKYERKCMQCGSVAKCTKGLCRKCYMKKWHSENPGHTGYDADAPSRLPSAPDGYMSIEEYAQKHLMSYYAVNYHVNRGTILAMRINRRIYISADTPPPERTAKESETRYCTVCGAEHCANGLCRTHYYMARRKAQRENIILKPDTEREREMCSLYMSGLSIQEIATECDCMHSEVLRTVEKCTAIS